MVCLYMLFFDADRVSWDSQWIWLFITIMEYVFVDGCMCYVGQTDALDPQVSRDSHDFFAVAFYKVDLCFRNDCGLFLENSVIIVVMWFLWGPKDVVYAMFNGTFLHSICFFFVNSLTVLLFIIYRNVSLQHVILFLSKMNKIMLFFQGKKMQF